MILLYISGPVLGAIIGYITNDIAIRMLFRPRKAKYILGIHVPFTPGIIPKEKDRIAGAIGGAISDNLMNKEVLEKTLLSDDMLGKLRTAIDEFFETQLHNDETLQEFAAHYLTDEEIAAMRESTCDEIAKLITAKLRDRAIGASIAHAATQHVIDKTRAVWQGKSRPTGCLRSLPRPSRQSSPSTSTKCCMTRRPACRHALYIPRATNCCRCPCARSLRGMRSRWFRHAKAS